MTIGKWLGSTLFTWYGAGVSILYYLLAYHNAYSGEHHLANEILVLILGGLFAQALALLLSLQIVPQIRHEHSNKTFRYFLAGGFIGIIATSICLHAQKDTFSISWHHLEIHEARFYLISLLIFLGWTVVGLYRSFSKELQYQHIPWVWLLFNIFCMIYFSGFASFDLTDTSLKLENIDDLKKILKTTPYYLAFSIASLLTYIALFADALDSIRYRKILARIAENNVIESLQQLPWWVISFSLAILAGVLTCLIQNAFTQHLENVSPTVFILTSLCFLLRDILLVHYFFLSNNPKRAQSAAILYLAILWIALPLLLNALHLNHLLPALLPSWGQNTGLALISTMTQIALIGFLCWSKWQSTWSKI
ncbi:MAG TPA: hypothetical protein PLD88_02810 [Candidatus Berkiella sp.]|nr:hypothetical protein [Candidatus Berkiella sp.]